MTKFLFAWNDQGVLARSSNDYSLTTPVWEAIDAGIVGKINDICPDWWSEFYTTGHGSGALGAYAVATQGSALRIYYSSNILAATVTWTQQTSFNIYKTPPASGGLDTSVETSARIAASKEEEGFVIVAWRTLRANVFTQTVDGGTIWATPTAIGISSSTDLVGNTNIGLALSEKLGFFNGFMPTLASISPEAIHRRDLTTSLTTKTLFPIPQFSGSAKMLSIDPDNDLLYAAGMGNPSESVMDFITGGPWDNMTVTGFPNPNLYVTPPDTNVRAASVGPANYLSQATVTVTIDLEGDYSVRALSWVYHGSAWQFNNSNYGLGETWAELKNANGDTLYTSSKLTYGLTNSPRVYRTRSIIFDPIDSVREVIVTNRFVQPYSSPAYIEVKLDDIKTTAVRPSLYKVANYITAPQVVSDLTPTVSNISYAPLYPYAFSIDDYNSNNLVASGSDTNGNMKLFTSDDRGTTWDNRGTSLYQSVNRRGDELLLAGNNVFDYSEDLGTNKTSLLGNWASEFGTVGTIRGFFDVVEEYDPETGAIPRNKSKHTSKVICGAADEKTTVFPVSLLDGEKREQITDLSVVTPAGTLEFTRFYRQNNQALFRHMGAGWTHSHYAYLEVPLGEPDTLIAHMPDGGILHFTQSAEESDRYDSAPGSTTFITVDSGSTDARYVLTAQDQSAYAFNEDQWLSFRAWPNGERWDYTYDIDNNLIEVADEAYDVASGKRRLEFTYIPDPQDAGRQLLSSVTDHSGRSVEFNYVAAKMEDDALIVDAPFSLLSSITDVRGQVWSYDYYGQNSGEEDFSQLNYLTRYVSPLVDTTGDGDEDIAITIKQLEYSLSGEAVSSITQQLGIEGVSDPLLETEFNFHLSGVSSTTQVTEEITAGVTKRHLFAGEVFAGTEDAQGNYGAQSLNPEYRPERQIDANQNPTFLDWTPDGAHLTGVTDALGNATVFSYDEDRLATSEDTEGRITEYTYGDTSNPRLPTRIKVIDANETVLRWQEFTYDAKGRTLEESVLDPDDGITVLQSTTRTYYPADELDPGFDTYAAGLLQSIIQHDVLSPANDASTTYTYDAVGRIVKTQKSSLFGSCQVSYTVYDDAGNVVASICNYENSGAAPTSAEEAADLYDSGNSDKNQVTTYQYDALGRRVATTSSAGSIFERTTLTFYDALNRVVRTISGYVNQNGGDPEDPALWIWNAGNGRWEVSETDSSPISHGTDQTANIINDTLYNERGLVRCQRDTLGHVTLYGYDEADRLTKTVQSATQPDYNNYYVTGIDPDPSLSEYLVNDTLSDQDVVTEQFYDPVGNVIKTVDALGRVNFTVYDPLNRPVKTVRNASDADYPISTDLSLSSYVYSDASDHDLVETTTYDAMGRVVRTEDALGEVTLHGYDALGRQIKIIRAASQPNYSLILDPDLSDYVLSSAADQDIGAVTTYDVNGRVLYTEDMLEARAWIGYDGLGRQVRTVANALGTAADGGTNDPRSDTYDASSASDADLITLTNYDSDGRMQWTQDTLGRKTWYVYDSLGRQIKVIQNCTYISGSPAPEEETYVGEHATDSAKDVITQTVYDNQGRVSATIDARGNETHYSYDVLGRRTQVITNYVDGIYDSNAPDEDIIQTMTYDLAGRLLTSVDNAGNETHYEYDALGRRTKTIINYEDGSYNPAQTDVDLISTTAYNKGGQVLTTTDARETETAFTYDTAGRRLMVTQAANTPLAITSYTCYDKGGRVLRTIQNYVPDEVETSPDARDENGVFLFAPTTHGLKNDENLITSYTLDHLGRQIAVTDVLGNQTSTEYRKDGQVIAATDPEGTVTGYRYDGVRRRTTVVQSYQSNGEDPSLWVWDSGDDRWEKSAGTAIAHGADNDENIIVQVSYDKGGRVLTQRDPRGSLTEYEYDLLDRRTKLTNPLSEEWETAYEEISGGKTRVTLTDPLTFETQRDFDKLGRLEAIQYLSESPKLTPDVSFNYDAAGNRIRMSETDGVSTLRETNYGYDQARRLTSVGFDNDGDSSVDEEVAYAYDAGGLRTKLTLPGNLDITYIYDAKGQLVRLSDWDAQETQFAYDNVGRLRLSERANRLRSHYQYDAGGRLTRLHHRAGGKTLGDYRYAVDRRGNRTAVTEFFPRAGGSTTLLDKDADAVQYRLGTWTDDGDFKISSNVSASLNIGFAGDEATLTMGIGPDHSLYDLYIDYAYWDSIDGYAASADEREIIIPLTDDGYHTLEVRNRAEKNAASTDYQVRFKALEANRAYDLHTIQYSYDALSRLLSADYYTGGNLSATPFESYAYGYDLAGNLVNNNGAARSYNAANQLVDDGSNTLTYDANGNLTSDDVNSYTWDRANRLLSMSGASYTYDGAGNRISQTVGVDVTQYLLDLQPGLATVLQSTQGSDTTRYLHAPRGIHAQQDASDNWTWMLQDGLGSVRSVVDDSLSVLESRLYEPYGTPFGTSGTNQTMYGFTGEPTDANDLLYLRARYYAPGLGVFTGLDPLELSNRYSYVNSNPVNFSDPTGYQGEAGSGAVEFCRSQPGILKGLCFQRLLLEGAWLFEARISDASNGIFGPLPDGDITRIVIEDELPIAAHFMRMYLGYYPYYENWGGIGNIKEFARLGEARYMNLYDFLTASPIIVQELQDNYINCVLEADPSKCLGPGIETSGIGLRSSSPTSGRSDLRYANRNWRFRLGFGNTAIDLRVSLGTFSVGAHTEQASAEVIGNDIVYRAELEAWDNFDWVNNDDPNTEAYHPFGLVGSDFRSIEDINFARPYTVFGGIIYNVRARNAVCPGATGVTYESSIEPVHPSYFASGDYITVPLSSSGYTPYHTRYNTDNVLHYP